MADFSKIKTISIEQRKNKVSIKDLVSPENSSLSITTDDFGELSERIAEACRKRKMVIMMMGAHVIKTGMSLLIIDLMKKNIIKHVAMNGAGPIHDFELAYLGETSEYVEKTIEDGTFGMIE